MIELDGSYGEGGGQIIRTALALSALTKKAFRIRDIRKNRPEPGLKMQHLNCVKAMQKLCNAHVDNAEVGSTELEFYPRELKAQTLAVDIGTAGSLTLLLQSLLPASILAPGKVRLKLTGGTDVKWSPQFDYFNNVIIPQLRRYADFDISLEKRGYFPKGNGKIDIAIKPKFNMETKNLAPKINLTEQGNLLLIKGISHASRSLEKASVADRTARSARAILSQFDTQIRLESEYQDTMSDGSGITIWAIFSTAEETDFNNPIIIGADALGERGKRSEDVGKQAAESLIKEINSKAPVDIHLGDHLIPYLALFGGQYKVSEVSGHFTTNIYTVEKFLGKTFKLQDNLVSVD